MANSAARDARLGLKCESYWSAASATYAEAWSESCSTSSSGCVLPATRLSTSRQLMSGMQPARFAELFPEGHDYSPSGRPSVAAVVDMFWNRRAAAAFSSVLSEFDPTSYIVTASAITSPEHPARGQAPGHPRRHDGT